MCIRTILLTAFSREKKEKCQQGISYPSKVTYRCDAYSHIGIGRRSSSSKNNSCREAEVGVKRVSNILSLYRQYS